MWCTIDINLYSLDSTGEANNNMDEKRIILCSVVAVAVLFVVTGSTLLILVLLWTRRSKPKTDMSSVFTQEEHGIHGEYLKKEATEKLVSIDLMEFPRTKLHLMNRVLGKLVCFQL